MLQGRGEISPFLLEGEGEAEFGGRYGADLGGGFGADRGGFGGRCRHLPLSMVLTRPGLWQG